MTLPTIFAGTAMAQMSATEIVKKAELAAYYAGDDGRSAARMLITDAQGRKQMRQFIILRKDQSDGGSQDMLVFFSRPADVKDTVFRVVKHTDKDDDRWLYLPGLDLVKRISAGDKRTSFVGSHFFYEDVSGRNTEQDNFTLLSETDSAYVLEGKPKDPSSVEFTRYEVTIDKENFLPTQIRFFNAQDQEYRHVEALKIETIQGHPTVTHSKVEDLINGGSTEMQFRFISYDLGLPEDIFTERSLRTPPRQWLDLKD
ncbi:outer membrane lipoprotein-sorting protein [Aliiglaciecola sp. CAU 1673]|uniref:outer membrane lipoprotein-sorting protein n=1 Tax=Aliiglaciecola sp. CAU 1673 TaxID=3032595 RepID=UPI0023DBA65E|nr:outer membrane lipoprotein-sorting protein [Aliiglaciecola sp. CAU 1673]MDF2180088.1 outer membrane lipoprotein-sorting protein [Aliiglaciecola sp. CAU 1673]